jgi:flagellar assembly protein FliH
MMSSSKVIKWTDNNVSGISEFNFRNIKESGVAAPVVENARGFVPLDYGGPKEEVVEEVVEEGPPRIEITEKDLEERISDAFNNGLKEGKELAERGLINVFRALRASSETIHNLRDKIFRESEEEIINLIMLVARKVIINEVTNDRAILAGVVQSAIAGLSARDEVTVRINPDDYQLVTTGREELLLKELLSEHLLIKPDPSVEAGFCLVDTQMGTIDASLDGQLEQIYRSLLEQRATAAAVIEEQ